MDIGEKFSKRLKYLIVKHGVTPMALSFYLSVTMEDLKLLIIGKHPPSLKDLCALADYFNVSLDYLVGRSDTPYMLKKEDVELISPDELKMIKRYREGNT